MKTSKSAKEREKGKAPVRENKNIYFKTREELGLTREQASDLLVTVPPERIEKIENERSLPHPEEVLTMSRGHKKPSLCKCAMHPFCLRI